MQYVIVRAHLRAADARKSYTNLFTRLCVPEPCGDVSEKGDELLHVV
jgi:hypothetical protein